MLTKVLAMVLVVLIGLALGIETARYVHTHAAGVGGVAGASSTVNIHRALLGFSLLATSGALLLSLRGAVVGAWLSRQWSRFTAWLELTLDGLFDFDALNVGDGASALSESARGLRLMNLYKQSFGEASLSALRQEMDALHRHSDGSLNWQASNAAIIKQMERRLVGWEPSGLLPCRGCSWCGVDPGDLPDELWTECDGSGWYLPSTEAERKRQLDADGVDGEATRR